MSKNNTHNKNSHESFEKKSQKNSPKTKLFTSEIVEAFTKDLEKKNRNYARLSKTELVDRFKKFITKEYESQTLEALLEGKIKGKSIDVELSTITQKSFSLEDFLDPEKKEILTEKFRREKSEKSAMESGLLSLYQDLKRDLSSASSTWSTLDLDRFLSSQGYQKTPEDGIPRSIKAGAGAKDHDSISLQNARKEHVRERIQDSEQRKDYIDYLQLDSFDPSEKIACVVSVQELQKSIGRKFSGEKKKELGDLFSSTFQYDEKFVPANTSWISMEELQKYMQIFFSAAETLVSEEELQDLKHLSISFEDCLHFAEKHSLLKSSQDKKDLRRNYSDLKTWTRHLANNFVEYDLLTGVNDLLEDVESETKQYSEIFDMPGNIKSFFEQFGRPADLTNTFTTSQYILLRKEFESLKDKLSDPGLSAGEKKLLKDELLKKEKEIKEHKKTLQAHTREEYFRHIAQQVQTAAEIGDIEISGEEVLRALTKLQENDRNISALSPIEQNILMKSSLAFQLLKVRDRHAFKNLGYSFETYAQFVTNLYDLDSKRLVITTKDKKPLELNFSSKRLVGKPLEFHNIDIHDIDALEHIRVEFEIDLQNNPQAKKFLRNLSGGGSSTLIQDFFSGKEGFPLKEGFPETITDSSLVTLTDKSGKQYEGYLSATDVKTTFSDEDDYGDLPQDRQAKTFILYNKPADQLHQDRALVPKEDNASKSSTMKPVIIHAGNIADRESITVKEEKVTLSDKQVGALTLGHMAAESLALDQFLDDDRSEVEKVLNETDESLQEELHQDTRDLKKTGAQDEATSEDLSVSQEFQKSRERLVDDREDHVCEPGVRLAVRFPTTIDGIQTIKTFPDAEQLLSMTVESVVTNAVGEVEEVEFSFGTLSRLGKTRIHNMTFRGKELDKIAKVFRGGATYVDNVKKDSQDYDKVLERLQTNFSDPVREKTYLRDNLQSLDFDGSQFKKEGEIVTRFISSQKTTDATGKSGEQRFDVEYTLKRVGSNSYRVTSTPYSSNVPDKDGKLKKENIQFDTTTDLAGVLLILANKQLIPYTKKEYSSYQEKQNTDDSTMPQMDRRMIPIGTIWSVLTGRGKDLVEAFKKKLKEKNEEDFNYMLFTQGGLMNKLSTSWLGKGLDSFGLNVFTDASLEIMKEGQEFGWKKINGLLEVLNSFHKSYNAYGPNGMGLAADLLKGAQDKIKSGRKLSMMDRWKAAAVLLYSMDQMGSAYTKGLAKPGDYVKILFGDKYYQHFSRVYEQLSIEAKAPTEAGKDAQDRLAMLEYNFIVSNTRGGSDLEKTDPYLVSTSNHGDNIFYFQTLYSRKFGNEVAERMNKVQNFSSGRESEAVKNLMATNNFDFIYSECKNHIIDLRTKDFVDELDALAGMAKDPLQADKVSGLFMAGILSGVFGNNLSRGDKAKLKNIMYNLGIPYASLIEKHNGAEKLKKLLVIASGTGSGSFSNFDYGEKKKTYHPKDFAYLSDGSDRKGFIEDFDDRFNQHSGQIIPFLHMDPQSLESEDNMIRIRKSQEDQINIFGRTLKAEERKLVSSILEEFYYVPYGRSISTTNTNPDSEFIHTASMIDQFFPAVNQYQNGTWKQENKLHADLVWENVKNNAPRGHEESGRKYMLSWHINEFFRYFDGIGNIHYNRSSIEDFYRYVRLAKAQTRPQDRIRLFRFGMTSMLYDRGPVPDAARDAFATYMSYFEENMDSFDAELGAMQNVPGGSQETFEDIFTGQINELGLIYIPQHERESLGRKGQNERARNFSRDKTLLNRMMETENAQKRAGGGRFGSGENSRKIGKSVDQLISELRGSGEFVTGTHSSHSIPIDVTNQENIDFSEFDEIPAAPKEKKDKGKKKKESSGSEVEDLRDEFENLREEMGI